MEQVQQWEEVSDNGTSEVCRHKVEGGWLYTVTVALAKVFTTTFVPDVDLARYQAHLRDAYNQGCEDTRQETKFENVEQAFKRGYAEGHSHGEREAAAKFGSSERMYCQTDRTDIP